MTFSSRALLLDTTARFGQGRRLDPARALASRPGMSFVQTRAGRMRMRHQPCAGAPRIVCASDGPNTIEHYDALFAALEGRADLRVFDPPGTGGSAPHARFDFSLRAFADATIDLLEASSAGVLVAPCYFGFVGVRVASERPDLVRRLVLPQTPSWSSFDAWAERVDRRRLVRTPFVGQLLLAARRRSVAASWYRASAAAAHRAPFTARAHEALAFGGCFALASLMQAMSHEQPAPPGALPPLTVLWGTQDRSHRGSAPYGDTKHPVITFADRGHSPELEAPAHFAEWVLTEPAA